MKRRLFKLALFILVGMAVTTLFAWSLALFQPLNPNRYFILTGNMLRPTNGPLWHIKTDSHHGLVSVILMAMMEPWPNSNPEQTPHWSSAAVPPTLEDVKANVFVIERAYGWPMLTHVHRETTQRGNSRANVESRITIPWFSQNGWPTKRALPLAPIWPGFAINTVFYAVILWLLTLGPFTARRMIRRKRGLCIKCGYDLRGTDHDKCPECGWGREAKG